MIVWLRAGVVMVTAALLQVTLFDGLRIAGVMPEIVLALSVAAGLTGGPANGAVFAFGTGLVADLFVATPFGLTALAWCIVAYLAGLLANSVSESHWLAVAPLVTAATAAGLGWYVLLGELLGQRHFYTPALGRIIGVNVVVALVVGGPLCSLMRFVWRQGRDRLAPDRPLRLVN